MIFTQKNYPVMCQSNIAILMATYNGEEFIQDQLDSILKQTYKDWEIFIHDDGSTDNTINIIKKYIKRFPNKIHLLIGGSTGNAKNNFFYLMNNVISNYYMFSDQDDYWLKNKISKSYYKLIHLENGDNAVPALVFTDLRVVDKRLNVISNKLSRYEKLKMSNTSMNRLLIQNIVTGCTIIMNKGCRTKALKCINSKDVLMHDWWCALVASYFGKIDFVDEALILYRQHGVNSVGAKNVNSLDYVKEKLSNNLNIKKSLIDTQKQISIFVETYQIKEKYLINYSKLTNFNKIKRIGIIISNKIWKSGFIRNIALLYFC